MKRKLQFTLVTIASLINGQNTSAQIVTYNFENVTAPTTTITGTTILDGVQEVVSASTLGLTGNTTNVLHAKTAGTYNQQTVSDFTNFPTNAADCSVTWKEYHTVTPPAQLKKAFVLRGSATDYGWQPLGVRQGYLFILQNETNGTVTFRIHKVIAGSSLGDVTRDDGNPGATRIDGVEVGFALNKAMYYRASVISNALKFEYSTDGITFTTAISGKDSTYNSGGVTQLVTGIGYHSPTYYFDDITYRAGANLGVPSVSLNEKSFSAFKKDNTININSAEAVIKSVQLFDANGRVIATKNNVNALETSISNQDFAKGLILVQITGENDKVATIKLVN